MFSVARRDGWTAHRRSFFAGRAPAAGLGLAGLVAAAVLFASQVGGIGAGRAAPDDAGAAAQAAAYQDRTDELDRRQRFLAQIVEVQADATSPDEAAAFDAAARLETARAQADALFPLAARETRQLAFADTLAGLAEARAARAEQLIRRVGLNPRLILAKFDDSRAQGGPLLALARDGGDLAPGFARLGASLARMSTLERGLDAIPTHLPASLEFISSGFGFRSDPITGEPALHAGLDFRGPIGAPIHAAANGTVTFAGTRSGYGNCLEISHGNGMTTRYAHMSAFRAHVGQAVAAGDVVGAIGNSGRSTGPHLHFEVRIDDHAVNPRPFLEAGAPVRG